MLTYAFMMVAGFVLLYFGGEAMVRGAVALGQWLDLSPLVVGIIIIGLATSLPELVVSVQAVLLGKGEIATGNILGSNIANIMLVLGVTALIRPMHHQPRALTRDAAPLLISAIVFVAFARAGVIHPLQGLVLFTALIALMAWEFQRTRREVRLARELEEELEEELRIHPLLRKPPLALLATAIGLAMLVQGGNYFVLGASGIADHFGVSEGLIGLTLVALGTSSPELASSVIAARHGQSDVAYGNVVGSNLFNILGVGGAAAMVGGLTVPPLMLRMDAMMMLVATMAMILVFAWRRGLTRPLAALFTLSYLAYMTIRAGMT